MTNSNLRGGEPFLPQLVIVDGCCRFWMCEPYLLYSDHYLMFGQHLRNVIMEHCLTMWPEEGQHVHLLFKKHGLDLDFFA